MSKRVHPIKDGTYVTSAYRSKSRPNHNGTDYRASIGTSVKAANSGVVRHRSNSRAGTNIEITGDDGYTTGYSHLSKRIAKNGQRVKAGQVIAKSGATGNVTGPHLHFYVMKGGTFYNPTTWLKGGSKPKPKPSKGRTTADYLTKAQIRKMQQSLRNNFPAYKNFVSVKKGQLITVDGIDGPQTRAWVKEFQKRTGLTVDGIVGPKTIKKMRQYGIRI